MTEADRLYREHAASLVRYLERQLGDRDLAEDVAQETFLRALRHEPKLNPRSWLFTTATNLLRDVARRDTRQRQQLEQLHIEQQRLIDESYEEEPSVDDSPIHHALQSLGERDRTALLLSEEGLSYNEIAVMLGMSMLSVGTTLTRARKRMIRHYESFMGNTAATGDRDVK
ncbi:MAG: sigma-70 family RNA polymerase sigma factor [Gemmatimonas sp.]